MSEQKVGCVPDGYMPIPTAEQIADALDGVRCFHDLGAELIAPELLANLLAVTSAKAGLPEPDFALDGGSQPCYYAETVQRIVAALSAQQSAPERVSVTVGLLERVCWSVVSGSERHTHSEAVAELRAILASHGRGEA